MKNTYKMKLAAMSRKQRLAHKAKLYFGIYLAITSLYGQYRLPVDVARFVTTKTVELARGVVEASGGVVEVEKQVIVEVPSYDKEFQENLKADIAKTSAEAAKAGADESIRKNLGK